MTIASISLEDFPMGLPCLACLALTIWRAYRHREDWHNSDKQWLYMTGIGVGLLVSFLLLVLEPLWMESIFASWYRR